MGGGYWMAAVILPGLKMTLPSKHSGSRTFMKSLPVVRWKLEPLASFLNCTVIGRDCFSAGQGRIQRQEFCLQGILL